MSIKSQQLYDLDYYQWVEETLKQLENQDSMMYKKTFITGCTTRKGKEHQLYY